MRLNASASVLHCDERLSAPETPIWWCGAHVVALTIQNSNIPRLLCQQCTLTIYAFAAESESQPLFTGNIHGQSSHRCRRPTPSKPCSQHTYVIFVVVGGDVHVSRQHAFDLPPKFEEKQNQTKHNIASAECLVAFNAIISRGVFVYGAILSNRENDRNEQRSENKN